MLENVAHEWAVKLVQEELGHYKRGLERSRTQHKILEETTQPDGSIILKVIKQYNASPVGVYSPGMFFPQKYKQCVAEWL